MRWLLKYSRSSEGVILLTMVVLCTIVTFINPVFLSAPNLLDLVRDSITTATTITAMTPSPMPASAGMDSPRFFVTIAGLGRGACIGPGAPFDFAGAGAGATAGAGAGGADGALTSAAALASSADITTVLASPGAA